MYDLRVEVEEVKGFCDLPMRPGDYFEVRGGRIYLGEGRFMCLWALQSLLPMLPLKQREIAEENDWVPHTSRLACPDPNGRVIFRIIRTGPEDSDGRRLSAEQTGDIPLRLLVDSDLCSGCRECEEACISKHAGAPAADVARVWVDSHPSRGTGPGTGTVRVHACRQCGNARCVEACAYSALHRDPSTKAVILAAESCTGCGACAEACSFGAVRFDIQTSLPLFCDLCGGEPLCVVRCAPKALRFGRAGAT